jgi:hypothetical protein
MITKKNMHPVLVAALVVVAVIAAAFLLLRPAGVSVPSINSTPQVGTVMECKQACESQSGRSCESLTLICARAGAEDLQSCSAYLKAKPDALDKYPCTYSFGQSAAGDGNLTCTFSCR